MIGNRRARLANLLALLVTPHSGSQKSVSVSWYPRSCMNGLHLKQASERWLIIRQRTRDRGHQTTASNSHQYSAATEDTDSAQCTTARKHFRSNGWPTQQHRLDVTACTAKYLQRHLVLWRRLNALGKVTAERAFRITRFGCFAGRYQCGFDRRTHLAPDPRCWFC